LILDDSSIEFAEGVADTSDREKDETEGNYSKVHQPVEYPSQMNACLTSINLEVIGSYGS
jgi:hypothetical protein